MVEGMQEIINTILAVEKRILSTVNNRAKGIETRLVALERKTNKIEEQILDIREELDLALSFMDEYGTQLIDQKKRIGRLEKRLA